MVLTLGYTVFIILIRDKFLGADHREALKQHLFQLDKASWGERESPLENFGVLLHPYVLILSLLLCLIHYLSE